MTPSASKWGYGGAYLRHPIQEGQTAVFDDGSRVRVHDIFNPLPPWMHWADVVFVDPPWNLGNIRSFYTKAEKSLDIETFGQFYSRLFECIGEILPRICYVEVGKEFLPDFIAAMRPLYRSVTFYNSSYYHKRENMCYVIRGAKKYQKLPLDYMDEEDIINWIGANEEYSCLGDLCIGRGLAAMAAARNGKRFVGTELNPKRLSVLLERITKLGRTYKILQGGEG